MVRSGGLSGGGGECSGINTNPDNVLWGDTVAGTSFTSYSSQKSYKSDVKRQMN